MNVPNRVIFIRPKQMVVRHRQIDHDTELAERVLYLVLQSLNRIAISLPKMVSSSMPRRRRRQPSP
jgi:hypothetical protein